MNLRKVTVSNFNSETLEAIVIQVYHCVLCLPSHYPTSAFLCAPLFVNLYQVIFKADIMFLYLTILSFSDSRREVFSDLPVLGQGRG